MKTKLHYLFIALTLLALSDFNSQLSTAFAQGVAGATWTAQVNAGSRFWSSVASSTDGSKLVAVDGSKIYTSTDSGTNWTARTNISCLLVASSADGSKLVAGSYGGQIYISTDSGVSWTARDSNRQWMSVASSADGNKLVAVVYGGQIYTSVGVPTLTITYSGNKAIVSWPSPSTGFTLQTNSNLATSSWVNYGDTLGDNGTIKTVTNSPPTGTLFFRLQQQ